MDQIPQRQAGDEEVGPAPHALVAVDDLQEGRVAHDPHHKHQQGHGRVDVLEGASDSGRLGAHRRRRWWRSGRVNRAVGLWREETGGGRIGRLDHDVWLGTPSGCLSSDWNAPQTKQEEEEERRRPHIFDNLLEDGPVTSVPAL